MTRSGWSLKTSTMIFVSVLIPLLVDDPLWGFRNLDKIDLFKMVLIPLLVDDPLWV